MKKISDRIASGDATPEDADTLESVAYQIDGKTICAFGEPCSRPTESFIFKFRDELKSNTKPALSGKILYKETRVAAAATA